MPYIGATPTTQSFISGTDYFNGTGSQTAFTLTRTVNSVNDIEAVVNNVVQQPSSAYTISGTTITFTSAPSAGTSNIYVRYLSTTTQSISPSQGTVGTPQLAALTTLPVVGGYTATLPSATGTLALYAAPQVTVYTSGSGTYTTPTGAKYLIVECVGGGGGGGGVSGAGSTGGNTTFGSLTAGGGTYGNSGNGGSTNSGGGASGGDVNTNGNAGGYGGYAISGTYSGGGVGGSSYFGGGGMGGSPTGAGFGGINGGGGGGVGSDVSGGSGQGGGGGGYSRKTITSPASTYSYAVGAGGAAGTGGLGGSGGAGGAGLINVTAYFG